MSIAAHLIAFSLSTVVSSGNKRNGPKKTYILGRKTILIARLHETMTDVHCGNALQGGLLTALSQHTFSHALLAKLWIKVSAWPIAPYGRLLCIHQGIKWFGFSWKGTRSKTGDIIQNWRHHSGIHYLPHHCVTKDSNSTTERRVVFDASAKTTSGLSLNDCLLVGMRQDDLFQGGDVCWRRQDVQSSGIVSEAPRLTQNSMMISTNGANWHVQNDTIDVWRG